MTDIRFIRMVSFGIFIELRSLGLFLGNMVLSYEAPSRAISGNFFKAERFSTSFHHRSNKMSDSESPFDSEPNVFDEESSGGQRDFCRVALSFNSADNEEVEVKVIVIDERIKIVPSFSKGKILPMDRVVPLAAILCGDACTSKS
ncbi:hypothetical protein L3X38_032237 [Prunus dulcis]|uniref:Uncharacterized protein n=1 Tax=Prunus dulcis TaxID=3755 RepID=A0AAD4VDS5_PRUDU|nr:hypothetical protein L3X38_032237 [Prunus dulcis]